jgi:SAM-dependent methyltransferase
VTAAPELASPELLTAADLAICLSCGAGLGGLEACPRCARPFPHERGIFEAIGPLSGTNRIAADFYNGTNWPRFRAWEQLFLWFQGPGIAAARRKILRHLPPIARARVLEVGIGDGENVRLLPPGWTVFGVDIARTRLEACVDRYPGLAGRLVWAEGEALPFASATFDAVFSIGGFNYFRDPAAALREMKRVARPGATTIVADELPDLYRFAPGHVFGCEVLDRWGLRQMGLDPEFVAMVLDNRCDPEKVARVEWPGHRRIPIWSRLGYCLVDPDPRRGP